MRSLERITESLIKSYNNNERPNYIDISHLELLVREQKENKQ